MADILKQNVGNKIVRQIQPPYKILKANYNFGKATSANIRIYKDLLPDNYSASIFYNKAVLGTIISIDNNLSENLLYTAIRPNNGGQSAYQIGDSNTDELVRSHGDFPVYFNVSVNGETLTVRENNVIKARTWSGYSIRSKNINYIQLGSVRKKAIFRFYSRVISQQEKVHEYNKGLGNEALIRLNLEHELLFNKAEILDFSAAQDGSDMRVGVRNYGSIVNGHGELQGLPAGTLQEQVDYANANLFVNFL